MSMEEGSWEFHRLTPERWADFEELFGERGAAGGCWCMWWRLTWREFDAQKGEGRGHLPLGNEADHALCD